MSSTNEILDNHRFGSGPWAWDAIEMTRICHKHGFSLEMYMRLQSLAMLMTAWREKRDYDYDASLIPVPHTKREWSSDKRGARVSAASASRTLRRLEDRGWVTRVPKALGFYAKDVIVVTNDGLLALAALEDELKKAFNTR